MADQTPQQTDQAQLNEAERRFLELDECPLLMAAKLNPHELPGASAAECFKARGVDLTQLPKEVQNLADARWWLIRAAWDQQQQTKASPLHDAIKALRSAWNWQLLDQFQRRCLLHTAEPAYVQALPAAVWQNIFRSAAESRGKTSDGGWLCPARAMAGYTLAELLAPEQAAVRFKPQHTVVTHVLLADARQRCGYVGQLKLERIPGGSGVLFPDPRSMGYYWSPNESNDHAGTHFQYGLQAAWLAVFPQGSTPTYDIRWSLEVRDPTNNGERLFPVLTGPSASAAFACAMMAVDRFEPLDLHVAVTARFLEPGTPNLHLDSVGSLAEKASAEALHLAGVSEICVATGQSSPFKDVEIARHDDGKRVVKLGKYDIRIVEVPDLTEAYELLACQPRITRDVNQYLAYRAKKVLDECDPYVRLPMSLWYGDPARSNTFERKQSELQWQWLEAQQVDNFCEGRPLPDPDGEERGDAGHPDDAPRYAVLAESGMGKTILLHDCLWSIAEKETQRVAILLDDLSSVDWRNSESVFRELVSRALSGCFREPGHANPELQVSERIAWLHRLFFQGNAVLLLDAVDQTEKNLASLAGFLASDPVRRCTAIVTGREHVLSTRSTLFGRQRWRALRLGGFEPIGESQANRRDYLGDVANDLLIEPDDDDPLEYGEVEHRKKQWEDLLRFPLLARLLRSLARRHELHGLKNRESVYERAIADLMEQGFASLQKAHPAHQLLDVHEAMDDLRELAWHSIGQDDFRGYLDGDAWLAMRRAAHHSELWQELEQVDVITVHAVLEGLKKTETRLSWRHLSFCEYFAGGHLAGMESQDQTEVVRQHGLKPQWYWVFRFALSRLDRIGNQSGLNHLATCLIRFGNPSLVYETTFEDRFKLQPRVEGLCRWLIDFDIRDDENRPATDVWTLEIIEDMFQREYRNSRQGVCFFRMWLLVQASVGETADPQSREIASRIIERFLSEYPQIRDNPSDRGHAMGKTLEESFVRCPLDCADDLRPFQMGSPTSEAPPFRNAHPAHSIVVSPFRMMRCPVTNAQYELFDPQNAMYRDEFSRDDDQPVVWVSWHMAIIFSIWLGEDYWLPTEAQWEYACRAGSTSHWCFGDDEAQLEDYAWCERNSEGSTHPVGTKKPNAWGLHDMHGNVYEWCQDCYREDYYTTSPPVDPTGPESGYGFVLRGGGWSSFSPASYSTRSFNRFHYPPWARQRDVGFRLARSL